MKNKQEVLMDLCSYKKSKAGVPENLRKIKRQSKNFKHLVNLIIFPELFLFVSFSHYVSLCTKTVRTEQIIQNLVLGDNIFKCVFSVCVCIV